MIPWFTKNVFKTYPEIGQKLSALDAMNLAIEEGYRGWGYVAPNPLVGCVILDENGRFLASGFHKRCGSDHAEIDALRKIGDLTRLAGAHVFVTLEPCAHQGRTPSCALTLAPLKLGSLTYVIQDPNPLVSGKGAGILKAAGTKVFLASERDDISHEDSLRLVQKAEELAEIFLHNMRVRKPFVAAKVGSTLDGCLALRSGESKWITGPESRERVQLIRAGFDAVVIGKRTFLEDNPSLNIRHELYPDFLNKVVVFDPNGETIGRLKKSNLIKSRPPKSIFLVVDEKLESFETEMEVVRIPRNSDGFSPDEVLSELKYRGLTSLLLEGGAYTFGSFFKAHQIQRMHLFLAPRFLGGETGLYWSTHFGSQSLSSSFQLIGASYETLGSDFYCTGRVQYPFKT